MTSGENAVNSPQREQTVPAGTVGFSNSFEPMSAQSGVPLISVVVPVYKEEKSIRPFLARMEKVLSGIGSYEIIFCLDPCPDETEHVIREEIARNDRIGLLVFSRRFGQPAATMAGILNCTGQWCLVIDVDLQDPPELLEEMLVKAKEGYDVVTARRISRAGETFARKLVASVAYDVINKIAEVPIPRNTGDFRIMSRRVVEELRGLSESHGFLRGLVSLVGFPSAEVPYERDARLEGTTKYNRFLGSMKIGFNGIVGFSAFPLQMMMWTGFGLAALSVVAIFIVFIMKLIQGDSYPLGIPTITVLVLFFGGVQLASVGLLGEYIGRIYDEVRRRPLFIVDRAVNLAVRDPRGPGSGHVIASSPARSEPASSKSTAL
ncbi:MAG: glycosyltransferase family 2 protein [Methylovirgula sp.]